jgi:uncharacterized membrane protein YkvA (DUF1232 family)
MRCASFISSRLGALRRQARLVWSRWRDPGTPPGAKLLLAAVAAYIILPFDLASDFIPILGWIDDLALIPFALAAFERMVGTVSRQA